MQSLPPIFTHSPELKPLAQSLAAELDLTLIESPNTHTPFLLELTPHGLQLISLQDSKIKPLQVNFLSGRNFHRFRFGGGKQQMIARAVGIKPGSNLNVLDITAGLGRDAFVLASLGCNVTALERSAIPFALLRDGIQRAQQTNWFRQLQFNVIWANANVYLQQLPHQNYPDVIYCDPMFPENKQSALVKKDMRILRTLTGNDLDADTLLPLCLTIAKKRVVVKRAYHAPFLNQQQPSLQLKGKSSRYDVYLTTTSQPEK